MFSYNSDSDQTYFATNSYPVPITKSHYEQNSICIPFIRKCLRANIYLNWNCHFAASIYCCKTFYYDDHTITEFGIIDSKNSSTAYVIIYELIDTWFLDSNRWVGVWSLPWRWHILSIPLTTGRGTGAETCGLDDVFPHDDLCSRPEALCLCIHIYIYTHICNFYISIWVLFYLVYQLCLALWW